MKFKSQIGFTLIELMIVLVVAAVLAGFALPAYTDSVDRAKAGEAMQEMGQIAAEIERFYTANFNYPDSLADLGLSNDQRRDPWGKNYLYTDLSGADAKPRRDANGNPVNTDYDLLSRGKDGVSARRFNKPNAQDDVVRAGNGSFIGHPSDY